jgi:hypothetical protein
LTAEERSGTPGAKTFGFPADGLAMQLRRFRTDQEAAPSGWLGTKKPDSEFKIGLYGGAWRNVSQILL